MPGVVAGVGLATVVVGAAALARGSLRLAGITSRRAAMVVIAAGMIVDLVAFGLPPSETPKITAPAAGAKTRGDSPALLALATIPVKGRAPRTGYSRDEFGPRWSDVDRNGCDTRNDILGRDLADKTWRDNTHRCVVIAGTLTDPDTGAEVDFIKANAGAVQIDHVVSLSDAWQKGAQLMDASTRLRFANDPLNLLAVSRSTNAAKGDSDAATWLPPKKAYRCEFVARQVTVKAKYHLWVTQAEHDAIARVLATCPSEPLASGDFGEELNDGQAISPSA